MSNKNDTSLTPTGTPTVNQTKRLSTIKSQTPGSPKGLKTTGAGVKDVVSPGELCGFVDTLLSQLETRFDEMSEQVLSKMNEMSTRIDNMEGAIQDLMNDTEPAVPVSGTRQGSVSSGPAVNK